ncbi:hypothetical protein R3P38DRAFT_3306336 [Favolaschia claudopus]|uniref:Uncharacterized protein n=1 Tax=Favolaschia claudopus TaxID=2862362 RepID=A0AAW0DJL8_9AGAR
MAEGHQPVPISNVGGELHDLEKGSDKRDRTDRIKKLVFAFRAKMADMVEAYMVLESHHENLSEGPPQVDTEREVKGYHKLHVVDLFSQYEANVAWYADDDHLVTSIVSQGLIPSSPSRPKTAVTIRALEMYRLVQLRCPQLGIQAWVRSLADLDQRMFKPSSTHGFTVCLDLYHEILDVVEMRVKQALGRGSPDWRMQNCCPTCTYDLEGEPNMRFSMFFTEDGNNSARRVAKKAAGQFDQDGVAIRGTRERADPRAATAGGDYFLTREEVDRWTKERVAEEMKARRIPVAELPPGESECKERWKNMSEDYTAKSWGVFDETGIFLALCRHGFTFKGADMVKSGELKKKIGGGYDCGCEIKKTIRNSPLGPLAEENGLTMLVGAFHGHAHNRKCQLDHLSTYVEGLGLEDLEGCERKFAQTNGLARCTRYASVMHRRRAFRTYLAHLDTYESYANLSTFLVNNYKQALEILATESAIMQVMRDAGLTPAMVEGRLQEEKEYLQSLAQEPEEETEQMEYYQQLVNLEARLERFEEVFVEDSTFNGVAKRHAHENYDKALKLVQQTESRLNIEESWTRGSPEWEAAAELVANRRYRRAVDLLEKLVLQRIFEFAKVGERGLAYKLRTHIAKALQVRSKAIQNAITRYNTAADAMDPPRRHLNWSEVVDLGFLAEFDIIQDVERHVEARAWATPAARVLLDRYFKLKRAKEEIVRLNVEIKRLITWMRDEREFLLKKEAEVTASDPVLGFFISRYRWQRARFDDAHVDRLNQMAKDLGEGFTGSLLPGTRLTPAPAPPEVADQEMTVEEVERGEEEWEDDSDGDDEVEEVEGEGIAAIIDGITALISNEDREVE